MNLPTPPVSKEVLARIKRKNRAGLLLRRCTCQGRAMGVPAMGQLMEPSNSQSRAVTEIKYNCAARAQQAVLVLWLFFPIFGNQIKTQY